MNNLFAAMAVTGILAIVILVIVMTIGWANGVDRGFLWKGLWGIVMSACFGLIGFCCLVGNDLGVWISGIAISVVFFGGAAFHRRTRHRSYGIYRFYTG